MKKCALIALAALTALSAQAADKSTQQASAVLVKTIGDKHVICVRKDEPSGAEFYAIRDLKGDLDLAFAGGRLTDMRESGHWYQAEIKTGNFIVDIGDDSPHDLLSISLADLKTLGANSRARATGLFYPSDEEPSAGEKLECSVE